jgi:hypothetical protein
LKGEKMDENQTNYDAGNSTYTTDSSNQTGAQDYNVSGSQAGAQDYNVSGSQAGAQDYSTYANQTGAGYNNVNQTGTAYNNTYANQANAGYNNAYASQANAGYSNANQANTSYNANNAKQANNAYGQNYANSYVNNGANAAKVPDYDKYTSRLVQAIIQVVLLASGSIITGVLGIVALIKNENANKAYKTGNMVLFEEEAKSAKTCLLIGWILLGAGVVLFALFFVFIFILAAVGA